MARDESAKVYNVVRKVARGKMEVGGELSW